MSGAPWSRATEHLSRPDSSKVSLMRFRRQTKIRRSNCALEVIPCVGRDVLFSSRVRNSGQPFLGQRPVPDLSPSFAGNTEKAGRELLRQLPRPSQCDEQICICHGKVGAEQVRAPQRACGELESPGDALNRIRSITFARAGCDQWSKAFVDLGRNECGSFEGAGCAQGGLPGRGLALGQRSKTGRKNSP
jgi:hypothetical protein